MLFFIKCFSSCLCFACVSCFLIYWASRTECLIKTMGTCFSLFRIYAAAAMIVPTGTTWAIEHQADVCV